MIEYSLNWEKNLKIGLLVSIGTVTKQSRSFFASIYDVQDQSKLHKTSENIRNNYEFKFNQAVYQNEISNIHKLGSHLLSWLTNSYPY